MVKLPVNFTGSAGILAGEISRPSPQHAGKGDGAPGNYKFIVPIPMPCCRSRFPMTVTSVAGSRKSAANPASGGRRRSAELPLRLKESGALITELVVAMAIILIALFPLAFSFAQETRFLRACYHRAIALEIVDGEVEVLLAGEWRAFKEGAQDYAPHALAATNLTSGKFQLTIKNRRVRLEWLPSEKDQGAKVVREVTVK